MASFLFSLAILFPLKVAGQQKSSFGRIEEWRTQNSNSNSKSSHSISVQSYKTAEFIRAVIRISYFRSCGAVGSARGTKLAWSVSSTPQMAIIFVLFQNMINWQISAYTISYVKLRICTNFCTTRLSCPATFKYGFDGFLMDFRLENWFRMQKVHKS